MTVIHKRRVVKKIHVDGTVSYIPQYRFLGMWFSYEYDDLLSAFDVVREYTNLGEAIDFIKADLYERQKDDLHVVWGYGSKAKVDRS